MNCKEIQGLLKTNYLDNELKPQDNKAIKEHLKNCRQCQKLEEELRGQQMLFQKIKREEVPEHIWRNIRGAIIEENLEKENRANSGVFEHLRELIWGRRPVFVLASTFAVIVFCVVIVGTVIHKKQALINGEEILANYNLSDESGQLIYNFGTNIEKYLL
ncbi:MAG: zf-HC2 domain-containing protein [Candidatus Omnitrophota bacterium]